MDNGSLFNLEFSKSYADIGGMPDQHLYFPGLAEVNWSQHRHALGTADDVAELPQA